MKKKSKTFAQVFCSRSPISIASDAHLGSKNTLFYPHVLIFAKAYTSICQYIATRLSNLASIHAYTVLTIVGIILGSFYITILSYIALHYLLGTSGLAIAPVLSSWGGSLLIISGRVSMIKEGSKMKNERKLTARKITKY